MQKGTGLDRSQPLDYFVPQEILTAKQARLGRPEGMGWADDNRSLKTYCYWMGKTCETSELDEKCWMMQVEHH